MVHPWRHYYEANKKVVRKKYDRKNRYRLTYLHRWKANDDVGNTYWASNECFFGG